MQAYSKGVEMMPDSGHAGQQPSQPNHLAGEKSPYLLQHVLNPVDWYPWGDEAFEKARREDKPIFLSIGYSTCHWCHVMERESFEDQRVAELMNDAFVAIKVDREERPDIDNVFMAACQMITGGGGWPLTIVMSPDMRPFYAGTYIPRATLFGRIGMLELIPRIKQLWHGDRERLLAIGDEIAGALRADQSIHGDEVGEAALDEAYRELAERYDPLHGGFGRAPKFPSPHTLSFLLRYGERTGRAHAHEMVEGTLLAMRQGGVFDQVGLGFHRYSTDREWLVPHFEKMLYDQAMLLIACAETYQVTGDPRFAQIAREIVEYVRRDMTSPDGAFYSAEDADSEGEEGRFYVWTDAELREVLPAEQYRLARRAYGVTREGNYVDEASGRQTGSNILHLTEEPGELARDLGMAPDDLARELEAIRERLLEARSRRIRPLRDDKVLTDWNGLMIAALSIAGRALDEPSWIDDAERAFGFVVHNLRVPGGPLLHRFREGEAAVEANLDDFAFLTWGLLELHQASFKTRYLQYALQFTEQMLAKFSDPEGGGLYFTAEDAETVLARRKEYYDGAIPSGNSVAALNLLRLSHITGRSEFAEAAQGIIRSRGGAVNAMPSAHAQLLTALDLALNKHREIVIVGDPDAPETRAMVAATRELFAPHAAVLRIDPGREDDEVVDIVPGIKALTQVEDKPTAYVCEDFACHAPVTDADALRRILHGGG